MVMGKHEECYDRMIRIIKISLELMEFKNLIIFKIVYKKSGKKLATTLLMTRLFPHLSTCTVSIKKNERKLLVGPPMLTTSSGFGRGANSSCHALAALRRAAESI